ncbi:hypothetical protein AVEN_117838-1 [Araneus ventricosus]|uniref:Uncharacterized protein n=1 Tax=Araneus ventricosus TaxID=182803 RepID=A0A4Y2NN45_ARAVE|nr:hypothetical protein AVEN_117838-1 [Araneus ventricosus]
MVTSNQAYGAPSTRIAPPSASSTGTSSTRALFTFQQGYPYLPTKHSAPFQQGMIQLNKACSIFQQSIAHLNKAWRPPSNKVYAPSTSHGVILSARGMFHFFNKAFWLNLSRQGTRYFNKAWSTFGKACTQSFQQGMKLTSPNKAIAPFNKVWPAPSTRHWSPNKKNMAHLSTRLSPLSSQHG